MALTLPYPNMDFVPLDILTASELDQMVANIEYIASGSVFPLATANIANNAITTAKIADNAVTSSKIDFTTLGFATYSTTEHDTGYKWSNKAIYMRTMTFTISSTNTWVDVGEITDSFGIILSSVGMYKRTDNVWVAFPRGDGSDVQTYYISTDRHLRVRDSSNTGTGYITFLYTKSV